LEHAAVDVRAENVGGGRGERARVAGRTWTERASTRLGVGLGDVDDGDADVEGTVAVGEEDVVDEASRTQTPARGGARDGRGRLLAMVTVASWRRRRARRGGGRGRRWRRRNAAASEDTVDGDGGCVQSAELGADRSCMGGMAAGVEADVKERLHAATRWTKARVKTRAWFNLGWTGSTARTW
jgi:hypothetical protein